MKRHLTTFKTGSHTVTGTRLLTFVTFTGSFTIAGAMSRTPPKRKSPGPRRPARRVPLCQGSLLLCLWAALAWPELVLHVSTAGSGLMLNSGLLLGPLFALVPALLMAALCGSLPRRWRNYLAALLYSLLTLVFTLSMFLLLLLTNL